MGQYYILANLDKRQMITPGSFGNGSKLLEFGSDSKSTLTALAILLADGNGRGSGDLHSDNPIIGTWAGDRIVVAGDYADTGKFLEDQEIKQYWDEVPWTKYEIEQEGRDAPNLYVFASEYFEDVSEQARAAMADDEWLGWKISDHTFNEMTEYIQETKTQDALKLLGITPGVDWPNVTPEDLRLAIWHAKQRGPDFFKAFRTWLLKKKLSADTRKFVGKMKVKT